MGLGLGSKKQAPSFSSEVYPDYRVMGSLQGMYDEE